MPPRQSFSYNKDRLYIALGLIALNIIIPLYNGINKEFNSVLITWRIIAVIFFLWFFFRFGYAAFTGNYAIELTSEAIDNNIIRTTIPWNEVEKLNVLSGKASHILVVHLTTLDKHTPRNFIGGIIRNLAIKKYGSPIIINTKVLNVTAPFLLSEMLVFKEKYDLLNKPFQQCKVRTTSV
ncbi:MAG: hypothetical protein ACXVAY_12490 [Mucilaginibacter sp.]